MNKQILCMYSTQEAHPASVNSQAATIMYQEIPDLNLSQEICCPKCFFLSFLVLLLPSIPVLFSQGCVEHCTVFHKKSWNKYSYIKIKKKKKLRKIPKIR